MEFGDLGRMAVYFQGAGRAVVINFRDLGSKLIILGDLGSTAKKVIKSHLKGKAFISFNFF